jgi:hypothetical protein
MPVQEKTPKLIFLDPDVMIWAREHCKKNGIVMNTVIAKQFYKWCKENGFTHKTAQEYEQKKQVQNDL